MYSIKEKQGGPIPTGLKSWPLKLVKHLAETPCGRSNPMGDGVTLCSYIRRLGSFFWVQNFEFQYSFGSEVLSKGSKWLLHIQVQAEPKVCMQLP